MEASAKSAKEIAALKSDLRRRYRTERSLHNPTSGTALAHSSWRHILSATEISSQSAIASYLSYGDEPTTIDINQALLAAGKRLFLPRVLADNDLEWVEWSGDSSSLKKVGKNLWEPMGEAAPIESIGAFIVPALHINRTGYRLGQGGGSYDRALARTRAWSIGLIYAGELTSEELPVEQHDQSLNAAATPSLIVRFN